MTTRPPFENPDRQNQPFAIVVYGASGDLTARKLIPALFSLFHENRVNPNFRVIGVARKPESSSAFASRLFESAQKYSRHTPISTDAWNKFAGHLDYLPGNFDNQEVYKQLESHLNKTTPSGAQRLFYLATGPEYFGTIVNQLHDVHLIGHENPARVVVEKPFGHDWQSASDLVEVFHHCLKESEIFRIDHYLGKETVQNLLYFRFANLIYEPIWNRQYIDNIQITVAEMEGVGGRGAYYDSSGALRDMVQNHILQLLAFVAMECPVYGYAESLRDEKVKLLRSVLLPTSSDLMAIRAQYEGYTEEPRVDPKSTTETFAAMRLFVDNWRWAGVPFYIRTGKNMAERRSEIVVNFKKLPYNLLQSQRSLKDSGNQIHIRLQPDEGIHLRFNVKKPGDFHMENVEMDFAYASKFGSYTPEAYERLLADAITGDQSLFTRTDETLACWRITDAILTAWQGTPLHHYQRGSCGPDEAFEIIRKYGHAWLPMGTEAVQKTDLQDKARVI